MLKLIKMVVYLGCYMNKMEYKVLSFYLTRALFIGNGFSMMVSVAKNNAIICGFLGMLLGYFLLYLAYRKNKINKFCNILISIVVLVILTLGVTVLANTYLLFKTPSFLVMISLIIVLLYGSNKEMRNISWISVIIFCVSILIVGMAYVSLFKYTQLTNLLPLFNTNTWNSIKGIIIFAGTSFLPNLLLINYKNDLKFKDVSHGYIVACLLMLLVLFFILNIYGYEFAALLRFPEYSILRNIEIMGVINNIENILIMEWIFCLIVTGLVCCRVLRDSMNKVIFYLIIILIILGFKFLLFSNDYVNILYIKNYSIYVYFGIAIIALLFKGTKQKN